MSDLPLPDPTPNEALDIQHDTNPADDHGIAKHIPHLGHALLFFSLTFFLLNVSVLCLMGALHLHTEDQVRDRPGVLLAAQAITYIISLAASYAIFPRFWERTFGHGIQWNTLALRRKWYWIVPLAVTASLAAQFAQRFTTLPKESTLDRLLHTPSGAWEMAAFGVLLAPLMEEIGFRGFLLPALAIAYDWLMLERTPAGIQKWQSSTPRSTPALVFAAVFSSLPFALLHAGQLQHAWGAISVLFCVGLLLAYVRVRTHSLACSTLLHAVYNLTIFCELFYASGAFRHLERLK